MSECNCALVDPPRAEEEGSGNANGVVWTWGGRSSLREDAPLGSSVGVGWRKSGRA